MIAGTRKVVTVVLALCCLAVLSPKSFGADQAALSGCSSLSDAIERPDGSIIAVGTVKDCFPYPGDPRPTLVGLDQNGRLLTNFGEDGFVQVSGTNLSAAGLVRDNVLLARPGGGVIVLSSKGLLAYDQLGQLDPAFGEAGILRRPDLAYAVIGQDQSLYARWGENGNTVGKFDLSGAPDMSFGQGGELSVDPGWIGPAVDSNGRLLFAEQYVAIRLLPDGTPDSTFGTEADGRVDLDVNPAPPGNYFPGLVTRIESGPDDSLYVLGSGSVDLYTKPSFITAVDSAGTTVPGFPQLMNTEDADSVGLFDGGIAYSVPPGRFDSVFPMKVSATGWPGPVSVFFIDEQTDSWASGTTRLADGSVLAVGGAFVTACPPRGCQTETRMALARIGPSGQLDASFGTGGKVVLPNERCLYGSRKTNKSSIRSCLLKPPRVRGSVQVHRPRSANPWIQIKATLGMPPRGSGEITQKLVFDLPVWARVKSINRLRKTKARVRSGAPVKVQVAGRKLTATVEAGRAVTFRIRIPRGAIGVKSSAVHDLKKKRV